MLKEAAPKCQSSATCLAPRAPSSKRETTQHEGHFHRRRGSVPRRLSLAFSRRASRSLMPARGCGAWQLEQQRPAPTLSPPQQGLRWASLGALRGAELGVCISTDFRGGQGDSPHSWCVPGTQASVVPPEAKVRLQGLRLTALCRRGLGARAGEPGCSRGLCTGIVWRRRSPVLPEGRNPPP